jgi:tRNA modification GTPase
MIHDTIVAVATPPGRGGIGVVRVSGPDAVGIVRTALIRGEALEARKATFIRIAGRDGVTLDQAVVTWFAAPHSYTGEDVVEISGHGSPVLLQRIVEMAIGAGARLAEPGEFTLRAYLNGRIDLAQAEAVADLVDAVTPLQARAAMDQLEGTLTSRIGQIDAALFDLSARLEASLDFADEGYHFVTREDAATELARLRHDLDTLARDGQAGRVIREGRLVVIVGAPNAGKSSLFNALVGSARAIVTAIPGTTRDLLTEQIDLDGLAVTLVDTAGLRETTDVVEVEGVDRARQAQRIAALRLVVLDGAAPDAAAHRQVLAGTPEPRLVTISKSDQPRGWTPRDVDASLAEATEISVVTGDGLAMLRRRLMAALTEREELRDPPAITNVRHLTLVREAAALVARAHDALLAGTTEELLLVDLGAARRALELITGRRSPDDLLNHIFARFCVGK